MRVVFVTTVFDDVQNGPGIYAQYLWRAYCEDPDIDFHLVAPTSQIDHPNIHTVGAGGSSVELYQRVQDRALRLAESLGGRVIIHGNAAHSMWAFHDYTGPWIVQVNDYDAADAREDLVRNARTHGLRRAMALLWRRRRERAAISRATSIVCNSSYTLKKIGQQYPIPRDRCRVIYKAVDTSHFRRPADMGEDPLPGVPRGQRVVLVGTNWRIKGVDYLIEAAGLLAADYPDLRVVIGGPKPTDPNHETLVLPASLGIADRVTFLGRVSRESLPQLLWHSDLLCLPSLKEALGVAILEGLAAGLPVAASEVGGIPEIIQPESYCEMFPPRDSRAIADALRTLLDAPDRFAVAKEQGPRRAEDFSLTNMTRQVKALYEELNP